MADLSRRRLFSLLKLSLSRWCNGTAGWICFSPQQLSKKQHNRARDSHTHKMLMSCSLVPSWTWERDYKNECASLRSQFGAAWCGFLTDVHNCKQGRSEWPQIDMHYTLSRKFFARVHSFIKCRILTFVSAVASSGIWRPKSPQFLQLRILTTAM